MIRLTSEDLTRECSKCFSFLVEQFGFVPVLPARPYAFVLANELVAVEVKGEDWGTLIVPRIWKHGMTGPEAFIYVNTVIELGAPEFWRESPCAYTDGFTPVDAVRYYAEGLLKAGGPVLRGDLSMWEACKTREAFHTEQARHLERR